MRTTAECFAEIAHQAAHVGAGAAFDMQAQAIALALKQVQPMHLDLARVDLDVLADGRAVRSPSR
jgi:hypothetical protein